MTIKRTVMYRFPYIDLEKTDKLNGVKFRKGLALNTFTRLTMSVPKENYFKIYSLEGMIMCPKNIYPCNTRNSPKEPYFIIKIYCSKGMANGFYRT